MSLLHMHGLLHPRMMPRDRLGTSSSVVEGTSCRMALASIGAAGILTLTVSHASHSLKHRAHRGRNCDIRYCALGDSIGNRCVWHESRAVAEQGFAHAMGMSGEGRSRKSQCQSSTLKPDQKAPQIYRPGLQSL